LDKCNISGGWLRSLTLASGDTFSLVITPPKPTPRETEPSRIRLSVWLLALVSGLSIIVVICLPHPRAPEQPAQPLSDIARHDAPASTPGNVPPARSRPAVAASEPMQKTLAGWVLDLENPNGDVVQAARKALAELGPDAAPAIPQLAQMLRERRNCNAAAYTLASIGTNALPVLMDALTNGNKYARLEAAGAIGGLGEAGEAAVPALLQCMRDEDSSVRGNAIASLQAIPRRSDLAVPALIAALADPEPSVHDNADTTLRKYAQVAAQATIPMLVQAAQQDQNPVSIRFRAAEIVRAVAPERAKAEGL